MRGRLRLAFVGATVLALGGCAGGNFVLREAITDTPTKRDAVVPPGTPTAAPMLPDVAQIGQPRMANIDAAAAFQQNLDQFNRAKLAERIAAEGMNPLSFTVYDTDFKSLPSSLQSLLTEPAK